MNIIRKYIVLCIGRISIEPLLEICLYTDTWLNACAAIERASAVFKGVKFDKVAGQRIAKRVIFIVPWFITITFIYKSIYQ